MLLFIEMPFNREEEAECAASPPAQMSSNSEIPAPRAVCCRRRSCRGERKAVRTLLKEWSTTAVHAIAIEVIASQLSGQRQPSSFEKRLAERAGGASPLAENCRDWVPGEQCCLLCQLAQTDKRFTKTKAKRNPKQMLASTCAEPSAEERVAAVDTPDEVTENGVASGSAQKDDASGADAAFLQQLMMRQYDALAQVYLHNLLTAQPGGSVSPDWTQQLASSALSLPDGGDTPCSSTPFLNGVKQEQEESSLREAPLDLSRKTGLDAVELEKEKTLPPRTQPKMRRQQQAAAATAPPPLLLPPLTPLPPESLPLSHNTGEEHKNGNAIKKSYSQIDLDLAVNDIRCGRLGTRRASVVYGIPRSTLRNKIYKLEAADEQAGLPPSYKRRRAGGQSSAEKLLAEAVEITAKKTRVLHTTATVVSTPLSPAKTPTRRASSACRPAKTDANSTAAYSKTSSAASSSTISDCPSPTDAVEIDFSLSSIVTNNKKASSESGSEKEKDEKATTWMKAISDPNWTANVWQSYLAYNGAVENGESKASSPTRSAPPPSRGQSTPDWKKQRPKRGQYRKYDKNALDEAVQSVRRGEMSVHRAGSYYGVPHSTLEYKVKERNLLRAKRKKEPSEECSPPPTALSPRTTDGRSSSPADPHSPSPSLSTSSSSLLSNLASATETILALEPI